MKSRSNRRPTESRGFSGKPGAGGIGAGPVFSSGGAARVPSIGAAALPAPSGCHLRAAREDLGAGVSNILASLGHTGRRSVVLGHTLNTLRHIITQKIL